MLQSTKENISLSKNVIMYKIFLFALLILSGLLCLAQQLQHSSKFPSRVTFTAVQLQMDPTINYSITWANQLLNNPKT
jgi:hypothetical protein